jgi:hypothetical protein
MLVLAPVALAGGEPFQVREYAKRAAGGRVVKEGPNLSRSELESLLKEDCMTRDLGGEFVELGAERMVATMRVDERHLQPFGYLHGGVSVVLVESVASIGAYLNCPRAKPHSVRRSMPAISGPNAPGAF